MLRFRLLFGTSPGFLQPDWVLFPGSGCGWCGCGCFCIRSVGSAVPFRSEWRCSHLWHCFGGWASFIFASVPVRPAGDRVRRGLPARVDVIVARPAVGLRMRAGNVLGTAPRPLFALLAGGRLPLVLPLSLPRKFELSRLLPLLGAP